MGKIKNVCVAAWHVTLLIVGGGGLLAVFAWLAVGMWQEFTDEPARPVGVITVDVRDLPSDECAYVIGHRDIDGRPNGPTVPRVAVDCP